MKLGNIGVLLAALVFFGVPVSASPQSTADTATANLRLDGPKVLVITYYVAPRNRLAFRRVVESDAVRLLAKLKTKGQLVGYRHLWNRYVDDQSWAMTILLEFASAADLAAWRSIEERTPSGLHPKALALVERVISTPADLMRTKRSERPDAAQPVFLVLPYDYLIGTDAYLEYVDGYVLKQAEEWIRADVLHSYSFYIARYGSMRPWSSLLVLEYRGETGLAARERAMDQARLTLANDPEFSLYASAKGNVREARTVTVADPLSPH